MEVIVLEERIDAIAYDDDWQVSEPEPAVLRDRTICCSPYSL